MNEKTPEEIQRIVDKWSPILNAVEPLSGWPKAMLIEPFESPFFTTKQI